MPSAWHFAVIERLAAADAFVRSGSTGARRCGRCGAYDDRQLPLFDMPRPRPTARTCRSTCRSCAIPEHVVADYQTHRLSLKAHPMSFLRARYRRRRSCARRARGTRDSQRVKIAGVVLVRQQPGSAKGVVFITIEDETGICQRRHLAQG